MASYPQSVSGAGSGSKAEVCRTIYNRLNASGLPPFKTLGVLVNICGLSDFDYAFSAVDSNPSGKHKKCFGGGLCAFLCGGNDGGGGAGDSIYKLAFGSNGESKINKANNLIFNGNDMTVGKHLYEKFGSKNDSRFVFEVPFDTLVNYIVDVCKPGGKAGKYLHDNNIAKDSGTAAKAFHMWSNYNRAKGYSGADPRWDKHKKQVFKYLGISETNDTSAPVSPSSSSSSSSSDYSSNASVMADASGNLTTRTINSSEIVQNVDTQGNGKGLDNNTYRDKGVAAPIVRINDHYFTPEELVEFYVETGYFKDYHDYQRYGVLRSGFVPTVHLVVHTSAPDLLKSNQVKSGDICAVFFSNGGGLIKSYRGDFIINSVVTSDKPTERTDLPVTYIIDGELNIPNLRNESERFNFNGTARDALLDASQRLGISFFFCDPDDTADYQGWVCGTNLHDYILDVAAHAWKEFNAFFDCWIDPRYGLSFINMNKMLIEDGYDEQLDLVPFVNTINNSYGIDGNKAVESETKKKEACDPLAKLITNIPRDDDSVSPFYAKKFNIVNRAGEIAQQIGINSQSMQTIDNPGVDAENTDLGMNYSIPVNMTKIQNGFFVLVGPGVNLTYTQADLIEPMQSFVKNSFRIFGGGINETMSDEDAAMMEQNGNNMYSSGNTNRFYDVGWEHNMRNNLQLQKQITEVDLQGCNLGVMRGEKIPTMFMDNDKVQSAARAGNFTASIALGVLWESASGWYIIDGIRWKWTRNTESGGSTLWTTSLKLIRREWPIPGKQAVFKDSENTTDVTHPVEVDASAEGIQQSNADNTVKPDESEGTNATKALSIEEADKTTSSEVPLTGLRQELKDIYTTLKSYCPKIKIVSARRWAVNEQGQRVEGNAFVEKNGLYKCANAKGDIMYFKYPNSRHLYGEAFDIINDLGLDFTEIMTKYILLNEQVLQAMAMYGVAACVEQTTDDSGANVKHYHFGTEVSILNTFWNSVLAANTNLSSTTARLVKSANAARLRYALNEIKNASVSENSL